MQFLFYPYSNQWYAWASTQRHNNNGHLQQTLLNENLVSTARYARKQVKHTEGVFGNYNHYCVHKIAFKMRKLKKIKERNIKFKSNNDSPQT